MLPRFFSNRALPGKVYEYRTYAVQPQYFPSFLALTNEKIGMRMEHSKLLGYWATEIGGQNEVVHLWEYEDLAARQAVRVGLGGDVNWNKEYMEKMRPMLSSQQNIVLASIGQNNLEKSSDKGVYLIGAMDEPVVEDEANLLGLFQSTYGDVSGTKYLGIWKFPGLEKIENLRKTNFQWSKIVLPTPFSPLQ